MKIHQRENAFERRKMKLFFISWRCAKLIGSFVKLNYKIRSVKLNSVNTLDTIQRFALLLHKNRKMKKTKCILLSAHLLYLRLWTTYQSRLLKETSAHYNRKIKSNVKGAYVSIKITVLHSERIIDILECLVDSAALGWRHGRLIFVIKSKNSWNINLRIIIPDYCR